MTTGHMDYLTGILRRLVFRISELLEADPTEDETERAPTSEWAFDHVADYHNLAGCKIGLSTDCVLVDGVAQDIPFDTKDFDVHDDFDLVNNYFVCPRAGRYLAIVNLRMTTGGDFAIILSIRQNALYKLVKLIEYPDGTQQVTLTASLILNCSAADNIYVRCQSTSTPGGTNNTIDDQVVFTNLTIKEIS